MDIRNATILCEMDNNSPPPGICTQKQYDALVDEKEKKCEGNGPRTCKGVGLKQCETFLQNIKKNMDCAIARENIMTSCFPPMGNKGHRQALDEALRAAANCEKRYNTECKTEEQAGQQNPISILDEGILRNIQEVTGLTGTALIIYVIISEGSRLFPPRNLVPIL